MRPLFGLVVLLLLPTVQATVSLDLSGLQLAYGANQQITGTATILYDELVPVNASLVATIDGLPQSSLSLTSILPSAASLSLQSQVFDYNITAQGSTSWSTSPPQTFSYVITAFGTCGGPACYNASSGQDFCNCPCTPGNPYPCLWAASFPRNGTVSAGQGLKFLYDGSSTIAEPQYHNGDTFWSVADNSSAVDSVASQACSLQSYATFTADEKGWIVRPGIPELQPIPGTADWEATIEPFSHASLDEDRFLFDPSVPGGIYKNNVYQGSGLVEWNGTTGYVKILNYDSTASYFISYLPPNGPKVCGYTDLTEPGSASWKVGTPVFGSLVTAAAPYVQDVSSLLPSPPACPPGVQDCSHTVAAYTAEEIADPAGTVQLSFSLAPPTVSATTTATSLLQTYTATVPLTSFPFLKAPATATNHTLNVSLVFAGTALAWQAATIATCQDTDGDGYCSQAGDCNDASAAAHPGGTEACDGVDNDCDGSIDEDFKNLFAKLNTPCGGTGACGGVWVCTPDGTDVACSSSLLPGQTSEVCDDGLDNDCDGVVDETIELAGSSQVVACFCADGAVTPCGSDTGACEAGIQVCHNQEWGACTGQVAPVQESCNGLDDNCDGVVDNVNGGTSAALAACACYGGSGGSLEVCNDIDDNCNGQVDENGQCCTEGQTRSCGTDVGACASGVQDCVGGFWGECLGGAKTAGEVCWNGLDENCNGQADELCDLDITCANGIADVNEDGLDCGGACTAGCSLIPAIYLYLMATGLAVFVVALALHVRSSPGGQ